jgi:hypothetical protein
VSAARGDSPAAWIALALLHGLAAAVVARLGSTWPHVLDWEGGAAGLQPWRVFTAAWVHWSPQHLALNLGAAAGLAALGFAARLPHAAAHAWLLAWPTSQIATPLLPAPEHLGGLSGVLHAGVAVAAVWLLLRVRTGAARVVGAALVVTLVAKLAWEGWRGPQPIPGTSAVNWPAMHLIGVVCGAALAALFAFRADRRNG